MLLLNPLQCDHSVFAGDRAAILAAQVLAIGTEQQDGLVGGAVDGVGEAELVALDHAGAGDGTMDAGALENDLAALLDDAVFAAIGILPAAVDR